MLGKSLCKVLMLMLLLPVAMSQTVQGAESTDACPKRLGMAANNEMTQQTAKVLLDIYAKLGCRVTLVKLPSRRSYVAFNKGNIDGEIFRTPLAASHYTRAHIRSEHPLFEVSQSLWVKPGSEDQSDNPVGFLMGIAWQEDYLSRTGLPKSGHRHMSDLIDHYNKGVISQFLAADTNVIAAIENGDFHGSAPERKSTIVIDPLYHFLGAEYELFMKRFSDYIVKHDPFGHNRSMQRP